MGADIAQRGRMGGLEGQQGDPSAIHRLSDSEGPTLPRQSTFPCIGDIHFSHLSLVMSFANRKPKIPLHLMNSALMEQDLSRVLHMARHTVDSDKPPVIRCLMDKHQLHSTCQVSRAPCPSSTTRHQHHCLSMITIDLLPGLRVIYQLFKISLYQLIYRIIWRIRRNIQLHPIKRLARCSKITPSIL